MSDLETYIVKCIDHARRRRIRLLVLGCVGLALAAVGAPILSSDLAGYALLAGGLFCLISAPLLIANFFELRKVREALRLIRDDPGAVVWAFTLDVRTTMHGATVSQDSAVILHQKRRWSEWLNPTASIPIRGCSAAAILALVAQRCPAAVIGYSPERRALLRPAPVTAT